MKGEVMRLLVLLLKYRYRDVEAWFVLIVHGRDCSHRPHRLLVRCQSSSASTTVIRSWISGQTFAVILAAILAESYEDQDIKKSRSEKARYSQLSAAFLPLLPCLRRFSFANTEHTPRTTYAATPSVNNSEAKAKEMKDRASYLGLRNKIQTDDGDVVLRI